MKNSTKIHALAVVCIASLFTANVFAQDWPQWRGPNRDAKAHGFRAPANWPTELTQEWKVTIGDGVSTPALVGDRVYVFSLQDGNEVIRCLDAKTGNEIWQNKYETKGADGGARRFPGPRACPAVAEGKVVTLGVRGIVSCLDAETGDLIWRKDDWADTLPRFYTACSPVIINGTCIMQLGGERAGAVVAYALDDGQEKWRWNGDGTAYSSPVLLSIRGTDVVIAETAENVVALSLADGELLWETPFAGEGRRSYNTATPIVDGQNLIITGSDRGAKALKLSKDGDYLSSEELWTNLDNSVRFNTPVLKDGLLFGLSSSDTLFCISTENGQTTWTKSLAANTDGEAAQEGTDRQGRFGRERGERGRDGQRPRRSDQDRPGQRAEARDRDGQGRLAQDRGRQGREGRGRFGQGRFGRGRFGRRGGGGGGDGYGSIVDAGPVLLALTPASELVAFEPDGKAYKELARIKVAETPTHAYPIVAGNRLIVKDRDSVALYTLQ